MKRYCIDNLCACTILVLTAACGFAAEPVYPASNPQQHPDVDNGIIVWAEQVEGDWDVYGLDLFNPAFGLIYVAAYADSDQDRPVIWNDRVVYQDNYYGDWDVWVCDISDANVPADYLLTLAEEDYLNDQTAPAVHGNTAVWQSYLTKDDGQGGTVTDWDVIAADITEPNSPRLYTVDAFTSDQTAPAVYRSTVAYEDNSYGDGDLWSADLWLKNAPQYQAVVTDEAALNQAAPAIWDNIVVYQHEEADGDMNIYARDLSMPDSEPFLIAGGTGSQQAPDISGNVIVWQDNRNGNWDIYGYNRVTKKEFQITTDTADQTEPAVSGSLVVWTDGRGTSSNIYYTWLDEVTAADCPVPVAGDANGDCRVDLQDYVSIAQNWLTCNLKPVSACLQ